MATLKLYAEVGGDGGCLLFTFDPPGLLARGRSVDEALARAPAEAARLREFLEGCGCLGLLREPWGPGENPRFLVEETVTHPRRKVANGDTWATFRPDLVPIRPEEVAPFLALIRHMRVLLWTLKDRIPPQAYSFRSLPHRMSIETQLRHVASCDRWYLAKLWPGMPRLPRSQDVWHKLVLNRDLAYEKLGHMSPQEMAMVVDVRGQTWTPRKVFRRFLYHEKFHLDTVERDLGVFLRARPAMPVSRQPSHKARDD